jgi:hypothetical protein
MKQLANGKHLFLIQQTASVMHGLSQISNGLKLQDLLHNNFLFKQLQQLTVKEVFKWQ